jgi:hypothetical protein
VDKNTPLPVLPIPPNAANRFVPLRVKAVTFPPYIPLSDFTHCPLQISAEKCRAIKSDRATITEIYFCFLDCCIELFMVSLFLLIDI